MKRFELVEKTTTECVASLKINDLSISSNIGIINAWVREVSMNNLEAFRLPKAPNNVFSLGFMRHSSKYRGFLHDDVIYIEKITKTTSVVKVNESEECAALAQLKYNMIKAEHE